MMPEIVARKKDWAAKMRILVTIHRWATMAICSTSTMAAISVIILSPNCKSGKMGIALQKDRASKQKRGNQGQCAQSERQGQHLGHAEQAQLGVGRLRQYDGAA